MSNESRISVIETKGARATTFEETLKAADLDWEPMEDQVQGVTCGVIMPRKKMLYRSDNKTPLGIVGEDYKPAQPREFLESQYTLANDLGGQVVRAGWTDRRAKAFAFIRMTEDLKISREKRKVGDPVAVYIYSTDGWDGGTPRQSKLYLERLKCTNGMTTKELSSSLWVAHTERMLTRYQAGTVQFKAEVGRLVEETRAQFMQLISERMTQTEMADFAKKLIPGDSPIANKRRETITGLFTGGLGNKGETRWDALNAVTEFTTYHATYRQTEIASAETSRFLGILGRNPLNERAMELLLVK